MRAAAVPRWFVLRLSCLGFWLLLCPALLARGGQDAGEPVGAAVVAADDASGSALGPLDPDQWIFVPDRPAREWLDKPPMDPADLAARPQAYARALESHGILFDGENGSFSVRGATIHDLRTLGYPIEYLVVTEQGRTHEAVVLVRAQPSVIATCVKALGLTPGTPTHFELKDPPPSDEELASGRISPWEMTSAGGPLLAISVNWVDDQGRPHEQSLESLLLEWRPREPPAADVGDTERGEGVTDEGVAADDETGDDDDAAPPPPEAVKLDELGWIFSGSSYGRFHQGLREVRWHRADVEGDVVAIYLDGREVCPFERNSLDGLQDSLYTLDADVIPPAGTPVTLVFRSLGRSVEARHRSLDQTPEAVTSTGQR